MRWRQATLATAPSTCLGRAGPASRAWDAAEQLRDTIQPERVVGYLYLKMPSDNDDEKEQRRAMSEDRKTEDMLLASKLLVNMLLGHNLRDEGKAAQLNRLPLVDVLKDWALCIRASAPVPKYATPANRTVCLVIHVDELQGAPWVAASCIRAIRDANDALVGSRIVAVPLLTGLSTYETEKVAERISLVESRAVHLKYFDPGEHFDAMCQVVINTSKAVNNNSANLRAQDFKDCPKLQYLVHGTDTGACEPRRGVCCSVALYQHPIAQMGLCFRRVALSADAAHRVHQRRSCPEPNARAQRLCQAIASGNVFV